MLTERAALRSVFAAMTALTVMVTVYAWTNRATATDWAWFYRLTLPVASASFLWGVFRPRVIGITKLFTPLAVVAVARVADFMQDWFLTPADVEPVDLADRVLLASYGWGMIMCLVLVVHLLERLTTARWGEPDSGVHRCWNAPGCPSFVDAAQQTTPHRHR